MWPIIQGILSGVFGFMKSIPLKVWLIIAGVIFILILSWRVEGAIKKHYAYVHGIEESNRTLADQNVRLNNRVNELSGINQHNQQVYEQNLAQANQARQVAEQERQQAEIRANKYRNIRDAIKATPQADRHPVSPVVKSTVDRLWDSH